MKLEFDKIIEGWRNHLIPKKEMKATIEKVAEERLSICRECPKFSVNTKKRGEPIYRPDDHCTECGCTIMPKVKSLSSSCPLDKWQALVTAEEHFEIKEELKKKDEKD